MSPVLHLLQLGREHSVTIALSCEKLPERFELLLLLLAAFAGSGIYMLMQILGGVAVYPICLALAFGIGYVWYLITEEEEI